MRGARHYRPDASTRLKKCSEHIGDDCTLCCAVTPCAYCLELEIYGETIKHGYAPESADHWTGTVDGHAFDAFWERNQYTDECEFVVELDSVEVYRKSCYEGQECRDSSDETGVTIGYDEATLRWIKHEPLPLPHIIGDEGCPTWFCGECECSCECVCVVITEPDNTVTRDELCNVAYECEGPRWEGQIGYYDLALALGRDSYGNCVLESTIDGEEQAAVAVVGCKDMSATITLYDGTTIEVSCKICDCEQAVDSCPCCPGWPLTASGIIHWSSSVSPTNDCDGGTSEIDGDFGCPGSDDDVGTKIRFPGTDLWVRAICDPVTFQWKAQYRSATSGGGFDPPASATWADAADTDFVCPDCDDAVGGIATGTIDFTAEMACEISGPTIITYSVLVHGEIEIGC